MQISVLPLSSSTSLFTAPSSLYTICYTVVTTFWIKFMPSLVPADERSIPREANITVSARVSEPKYSNPISKYDIIAAGTYDLRFFCMLVILSNVI